MIDFLDLSNKHILISGASGGIGQACAILLSKTGASLTITGRNPEKLAITQGACAGKVVSVNADLTNPEEIENLVSSIDAIDGFVHTAGMVKPMPIKFIKPNHIQEVFNTNLNSSILLSTSLLKKKKVNIGSSFVFLSSISSQHPYLGGALYVSSKAGLEAFVKTLALEQSNLLRANIISPGLVRTNILEETKQATGSEEMEKYEKKYPLGFGDPEDIANACAFFLSDRSKWITGTNLIMDGGLLISGK